MSRKLMYSMMFLVVNLLWINHASFGGKYGVGVIRKQNQFSAQQSFGIKGYIIVDPFNLWQSGKGAFYHTHANGSAYGAETLITYEQNTIKLGIYKWVPANHNFRNNLNPSDSANEGWLGFTPHVIGDGSGNIDPSFQKYVTTLALDVGIRKAIYFENISTYSGVSGKWREFVKLKNFDTNQMDTFMDIQWDGTITENYTNYHGHSHWAGTFELFNECSPYNSLNGKNGGNYLMDYINSSLMWVPFTTEKFYLKTSDNDCGTTCIPGESWCDWNSNSGFQVFNSNPVPGYWLATVP